MRKMYVFILFGLLGIGCQNVQSTEDVESNRGPRFGEFSSVEEAAWAKLSMPEKWLLYGDYLQNMTDDPATREELWGKYVGLMQGDTYKRMRWARTLNVFLSVSPEKRDLIARISADLNKLSPAERKVRMDWLTKRASDEKKLRDAQRVTEALSR